MIMDEEKVLEAILKRIDELREREKLSIYALRKKTGMPNTTLRAVIKEKRVKNPGIMVIGRIVGAGFDMSLQEFFDCDLFKDLKLGKQIREKGEEDYEWTKVSKNNKRNQ